MNNENLTPRKYKRYDENFKRSTVKLWRAGGKSVEPVGSPFAIERSIIASPGTACDLLIGTSRF
jgi:hypothetical protein